MWLISKIFNSRFTLDIYWIVLLVFALYLIVNRKQLIAKKLIVSIGVFLFLYPIWHYASGGVFYRLWWLFPIFVIIALGMTQLLECNKSNKIFFTVLLIIVYVLVFGNNIHSYLKNCVYVTNPYHVNESVIDVADMILTEDKQDTIVVVGEPTFMTQIRLYSAKFCWGYASRDAMMLAEKRLETDGSYLVATALQTGYFAEGLDLVKELKELNVDYVILEKSNTCLMGFEADIQLIGETDAYSVYKMR